MLAGNTFQIFGAEIRNARKPNSRCIVEHRVEKKRKIAESVWVHNVVTVRKGKVAGQCAMPYTPVGR